MLQKNEFYLDLNQKEKKMNTKKNFQIIMLVAILVGSFATTSAAFAASACGSAHSVVKGDTLAKIAVRCVTTVSALRRANPEIGSGNLIYSGQVLQLPGAILYGNNGYNTYIIARGDTLKALAASFGTTIDNLVKLNPDITNINVIYEGQRLTVPGSGNNQNPPPSTNGTTYVVQPGDTLRIIAARFNTSVAAILKVNPQITNQDLIYVGQVINLPASVTTLTMSH